MAFNHRIGGLVFAFGIGLLVAFLSYRWITDPAPRVERQLQEAVVLAAREQLRDIVGSGELEVVDPVAPDRKVGKVYVYRVGDGWEVSGFYRRDADDRWHPFLMSLDAANAMTLVKVRDAALAEAAVDDDRLETLP
jgi:hypothetical protein